MYCKIHTIYNQGYIFYKNIVKILITILFKIGKECKIHSEITLM